jgi:hypothetical protein
MAIAGLRHTNNFIDGERPQNWRAGILMLYPSGMAPLTALTAAMQSESVDDPRFNWFEKSYQDMRVALDEDLDNSETAITVVSGAFKFKLGDVIYIEHSAELVYVSANPSSDTELTVVRGAFGSTAASVTIASQNYYASKIGSAYEEGSLAPQGIAFDPTASYNLTQIFRDTYEATRTASKTKLRTKEQKTEAKRECLEVHSQALERAFWWGRRSESTLNGKPWRTTGGVDSFIAAENKVSLDNNELSLDRFEDHLEAMFRFGSDEKMGFCGNAALLAMGRAVRKNSSYNISAGEKEYGMRITRFYTPFGTLVVKTHPMFNQMAAPAGAGYTSVAGLNHRLYVLDMKNIKYRYFKNDDTRHESKLEIPGADGYKEGYISECGLEVHHPKTHYRLDGIKTAVVDGDET